MIFFTLINKTKALISQLTASKILLTLLLFGYTSTSLAVLIQNGRGLVGVIDKNYSANFSGPSRHWAEQNEPYIFLTWYVNGCIQALMMEIDGVKGLKFNTAGTLMLVPEVTFVDNRSWSKMNWGVTTNYSDTITGIFNGSGSTTSENLAESSSCYWRPLQTTPATSVNGRINHQVIATGRMLIYGTGEQVSGTASLAQPIRIGILDPVGSPETTYKYSTILPAGSHPIVVSNLGCTITTPTLIDFGPQPANSMAGEELATRTNNLSVNCSQSKNPIGATFMLIAGINKAYFSSNEYEVNLLKNGSGAAGAYVKMSIDVNGTTTPVAFNRQFINVGAITAAESTANFNHPVTYTLYSRGAGITGKVSGSAELSIVMR